MIENNHPKCEPEETANSWYFGISEAILRRMDIMCRLTILKDHKDEKNSVETVGDSESFKDIHDRYY